MRLEMLRDAFGNVESFRCDLEIVSVAVLC